MSKRPSSAGANRKVLAEKVIDNKPPKAPDDLFDFDAYFTDDTMWGYKQIVQQASGKAPPKMKNLQLEKRGSYDTGNDVRQNRASSYKVNTARNIPQTKPKVPTQRPSSSPSKRSSSRRPSSAGRSTHTTPRAPPTIPYEQHKNYFVPTPVRHHSNHDFYNAPETPGPGQYNPRDHSVRPISPSHSIQKARRFENVQPTTSRSTASSYNITASSFHQHETPGPGNYSPPSKEEIHNPLGWRNSFSKDKRFRDDASTTSGGYSRPVSPGPGAYRPNFETQSSLMGNIGHSFGKGRRKGVMDPHAESVPGPGAYDTNTAISPKHRRPPSASFGSAARMELEDAFGRASTPGPGGYDPNPYQRSQSPAHSFGKSKKDDYSGRSRPVSPGPNAYRPNYDVAMSNTVTGPTSFGKAPRPKIYNEKSGGPSVYDYSPQQKHSTPSYSFSKSKSPMKRETVSPGPSFYAPNHDTIKSHNPAYSFSTSKRSGNKDRSKSPGPDSYNISKSYNYINGQKSGASFGTAKRNGPGSRSASPGPGQYTTDVKNPRGAVSFSKDRRFSYHGSRSSASSPGPGQYSAENSYNALNRSESPSFTKQKRSHSSASRTPGPADYYPSVDYSRPKSPAAVMYLTG